MGKFYTDIVLYDKRNMIECITQVQSFRLVGYSVTVLAVQGLEENKGEINGKFSYVILSTRGSIDSQKEYK